MNSLLDSRDQALMAAFAEYEDTKNADELLDTVLRISRRWSNQNQVVFEIFKMINDLTSAGHLDAEMCDSLQLMVYRGEPALFKGFARFLGEGSWDELWALVTHIHTHTHTHYI